MDRVMRQGFRRCSPPRSSTWRISGAAAMSASGISTAPSSNAPPWRSSRRSASTCFTSCRPRHGRTTPACRQRPHRPGVRGHAFWDTEIYLLPFLTYTSPRIARNLLTFRYQMLPQAAARARALGHRGAMFPWRTINGEEASASYAAGTAQYHINADIMYALRKFVQATGDEAFLQEVRRRDARGNGPPLAGPGLLLGAEGAPSASTASPGPTNTPRS